MNTEKLAKQLKKELTRNLKKTAALGLVTLVALWFWAPLVWKWVGGDPKKKARKSAAVAAQQADATHQTPAAGATEAAAPVAAATPKIVWDELLARIASDENMTTAALAPGARDPFKITTVEEQIAVVTPVPDGTQGVQPAPAAVQDPTPESVGLVLEATFVSRHARRATINAKTYQIGQRVRIASAASADPSLGEQSQLLEYELKAIEARRVVLARQGKEFPLVLKRQSLTEDEQLSFGAPPPPPTQP